MIPFDRLWEQYKRIIKPNGAIALFGSQPFTSALVMSNPKWFKYEWIWEKNRASGFKNAKKKPMSVHENICIFYDKQPTYNPQFRAYFESTKQRFHLKKEEIKSNKFNSKTIYGIQHEELSIRNIDLDRGAYPVSIQKIKCINNRDIDRLAPTQKPVALIEYLIKTYTQEGEIILDNTAGSGTLAIAAINTNRQYICIENDEHYFEVMRDRVANHDPNAPIKTKKPPRIPKGQLTLF